MYGKNGNKKGTKDELANYLANTILHEVFGVALPADMTFAPANQGFEWAKEIWDYTSTGRPYPEGQNHITPEGLVWLDAHLCPWPLWSGGSGRRASGKFCKGNCTEQSIEHIAIALYDTYQSGGTTYDNHSGMSNDYYVLLIEQLFSALSSRMNYNGLVGKKASRYWAAPSKGFPDDNFVLTKEPTSYITIDYHDEETNERTGNLKIVVLDEEISTDRADTKIFADG